MTRLVITVDIPDDTPAGRLIAAQDALAASLGLEDSKTIEFQIERAATRIPTQFCGNKDTHQAHGGAGKALCMGYPLCEICGLVMQDNQEQIPIPGIGWMHKECHG